MLKMTKYLDFPFPFGVCILLEWGGAHALPRDENSLHEERARWHPTLLCQLNHFVRGAPHLEHFFLETRFAFVHFFFLLSRFWMPLDAV